MLACGSVLGFQKCAKSFQFSMLQPVQFSTSISIHLQIAELRRELADTQERLDDLEKEGEMQSDKVSIVDLNPLHSEYIYCANSLWPRSCACVSRRHTTNIFNLIYLKSNLNKGHCLLCSCLLCSCLLCSCLLCSCLLCSCLLCSCLLCSCLLCSCLLCSCLLCSCLLCSCLLLAGCCGACIEASVPYSGGREATSLGGSRASVEGTKLYCVPFRLASSLS